MELLNRSFIEVETLATEIEKLDEGILSQTFLDPKYGSWHRNLLGLIEHTHYHLGQIVLIRKILNQTV
jgi:hypothetical protein